MTTPRTWTIGFVAVVALVEILYLVAANVLLNGNFLPPLINRNPEQLNIEWSSGWTAFPGHLRVRGLTIHAGTPQQRWWASVDQGEIRIALWSLLFKTFHVQVLEADTVTAGLRNRASDPLAVHPAPQPDESDSAISTPKDEGLGQMPGWTLAISDAHIGNIRELEFDDYRFAGEGRLQLEDLSYQLHGPVVMGHSAILLQSGELTSGSEPIAGDLRADANIQLAPFVPKENPGVSAAKFVSGTIGLMGDMASFDFINRYLTKTRWLKLRGRGHLSANIHVKRGMLMEGSELSIDSSSLMVEMDESLASGSGERYVIEGAGTVRGNVESAQPEVKTRLQVELRDMAMRDVRRERVFLQGKAFRLTATSPPVDLGERLVEPDVLMEWQDAMMPDIAVLNAYIPGGLPFSLSSGSARLNGHLAYADRALSGAFHLAGQGIGGRAFSEAMVGRLGVDLVIKQVDLESRRLDLSGTRVQMQAAAPANEGESESTALRTDIELVRAELSSALSLGELKRFPGQPPLSGTLKLKGSVANVGFLNRFLPESRAFEIDGGGRMSADLRLVDGRFVSGSTLAVESDRLVSRFPEFEASGAGEISTELRSVGSGEEIVLEIALRDMNMRQVSGDKVFMHGEGLQLTVTSPMMDPRELSVAPAMVMTWQDAVMPDVAVLNRYIPGQPPFALSSGRALLDGRLEYVDQKVSGEVKLAGEKIAGTMFEESVVGQLGVDLVINEADLTTRHLDISGTRLLMRAATRDGESGAKQAPLQTKVTIQEARLDSVVPSADTAGSRRTPPVSGVIRLDGTVANIGFINSFLPDAQGLAFAGDGRIAADLRISNGKVAPGSNLEVRSANLVSRFLDFEASGAGLLTAAIQGDPGAPTGRIEGFLGSFGLRRLGDLTPYIRGRNFEITTIGKRFDSSDGIPDRDTVVKLASGEIPDISIYNAYLPKDAGVSIQSGKGHVTADFRLSGASGSGNLEMIAAGVEVHVKDQTIKGDLRVSTRLKDGNLEEMTFDASGTQLRIENGSLKSDNTFRDRSWWGQIDLEHGRMTWKRPLDLNATIALNLRDSGLLVHLFVEQTKEQQWLNELLTIKDITGRSEVVLNENAIVLKDTKLSGENLLVLSNLRLSKEKMQGGLYAKYGILGVGVELKDQERTWKILNPRKWYDSFAEEFVAR